MATTDAGHESEAPDHSNDHSAGGHGHHDHDHPSYLAHHFDTPEQQFDSGKLGMWLFLVTEVLFFSGMFCAYAIFRSWRPEVFQGCSEFLNTKLGAINTGVLLFSSFTMAWAVRCAQTEQHKKLAALIAATLSCAMMFLGVKAIEYSHKWEMGLLPAGLFTYDPAHPHPENAPNFLAYICAPFAIATVGVAIWLVSSFLRGAKFQFECAKPILVVCLCFFVGVGLGRILEPGEAAGHEGDHVAVAHVEGDSHGQDNEREHTEHEHTEHEQTETDDHSADVHEEIKVAASGSAAGEHDAVDQGVSSDLAVIERLASDATNTGLKDELSARLKQLEESSGSIVYGQSDDSSATVGAYKDNVLRPSRAGVFFSIYYCMTGVHAIHILAGIAVLLWLLVRAIREDFNRNYFGPVDYVGLYWHLVDLIWIYLFPLMYLIR